jgi:hypothetical protein
MSWLDSFLIVLGAMALDYGTLVQVASLFAHTRTVDPALIETMVRADKMYRLRLTPGITTIVIALFFVWSMVGVLSYLLLGAACLIGYFALQTIAFVNVARKLPKPSQ